SLGPAVTGAVRIDDQRFVDSGRYVVSLADCVRARGGEIHEHTPAAGLVDLGRDGIVVQAPDGELRADAAVIATGARIAALARRFGVRHPVQAGRGYSFSVELEELPIQPLYFPDVRLACT